jgi:hypothetical protein
VSREAHAGFCERRRVRLPPPTLLVVMCKSREQAEAALARLTGLLAELGLKPKAARPASCTWPKAKKASTSSDFTIGWCAGGPRNRHT